VKLALPQQHLAPVFNTKTCAHCGKRFNAFAREYLCPACKRPTVVPIRYSPTLSAREKQIVGLVQQAMSNKAIAVELCLSTGTIKEYLFRIFRKLGVSNRTELALWGRDHLAKHPTEAAS
jgi:DNA-binding NarL/FixJ family response regulator